MNCFAAQNGNFTQTREIRSLCKKAQNLEKEMSKFIEDIELIAQKERISAPIVRNVYEILARCCTLLVNMLRFSNLLILNQQDNKNDFVRCSIVIKNFASYFRSVNAKLGKNSEEIFALKKNKQQRIADFEETKTTYQKLCSEIDNKTSALAKSRKENIIQNDVVCHIASKSESIEELDAELEAENAIGVLKNTKIFTELFLDYPVSGKIVTEFGDKSESGEMIYCISFATCPEAIVTSPAKGLVVFSGKFLNYGNMIIISNGEYRVFLYGMTSLFAATDDIVEIGDYVGKMGDTSSNDLKIKMELKKSGEPLDPLHWLSQSLEKEKPNEKA